MQIQQAVLKNDAEAAASGATLAILVSGIGERTA